MFGGGGGGGRRYLSHEIRVPLNALSLGIGLLAQHDIRELHPNATAKDKEDLVGLKEHCDDLSGCCDAVLHLLKDVLDMEQMQSGLCVVVFISRLHLVASVVVVGGGGGGGGGGDGGGGGVCVHSRVNHSARTSSTVWRWKD